MNAAGVCVRYAVDEDPKCARRFRHKPYLCHRDKTAAWQLTTSILASKKSRINSRQVLYSPAAASNLSRKLRFIAQ